jgi:hypothetical protein
MLTKSLRVYAVNISDSKSFGDNFGGRSQHVFAGFGILLWLREIGY